MSSSCGVRRVQTVGGAKQAMGAFAERATKLPSPPEEEEQAAGWGGVRYDKRAYQRSTYLLVVLPPP